MNSNTADQGESATEGWPSRPEGAVLSSTGSAATIDAGSGAPDILTLCLICVGIGALATWYGVLEAQDGHPLLKLCRAMVLAGAGITGLLVARPFMSGPLPGNSHSALVSLGPVRLGAAWLSMSAALIHFAVIKQHFEEYQLYGWFFVVVATAQLVWAVLVVVRPSRPLLVGGALGNALVAGTWVLTRTYGSLIGPDATRPATAGFGDILSTIFEVGLVLAAVILVRSGWPEHDTPTYRTEVVNFGLGIGIAMLTVLALYSTVGGSPFVSKVG